MTNLDVSFKAELWISTLENRKKGINTTVYLKGKNANVPVAICLKTYVQPWLAVYIELAEHIRTLLTAAGVKLYLYVIHNVCAAPEYTCI